MRQKAAIYARISSDKEGRELGVDRQQEDCRRLAERRDLDVVAVFVENDTSASTRSTKPRPRYADMLAAARARGFGVIVAYSNSRLTRRPREYEDLIDLHDQHGVRIFTVASGDLDLSTANGRMLARMLAAADANEAEQTAERVKRAAEQRAEQGRWHGGSVPYGYRVEGDPKHRRLVLDDREAGLLRDAARRVLAGDSLYGVVTGWNRDGVTTGRVGTKLPGTGGPSSQHWRQGNLRAKLLRRSVLGENTAGVRVAEPVLDARTYERLHALLTEPSRNVGHSPGVKSSKYTMAGGLTVCGHCGKRMVSNVHRGRAILFCSRVVSGPQACGGNRLDHHALEEYALDTVVRSLQANERWLRRRGEPDPEQEARVAALEAEREDLDEQQRRLTDLYVRGLIGARDHEGHVRRIRDEAEAVRGRIDGLLGASVVDHAIDDGLDWRAWSPARRRTFLKGLLDRVEVRRPASGRVAPIPRRVVQGETVEEFEARRHETLVGTFAERVEFVVRSRAL